MRLAKRAMPRVLPVLAKVSDENLVRLIGLLRRFVKDEHHRKQLVQLEELFRKGHPAIALTRRIFTQLSKVYQTRLVENLGFNAVWEGIHQRRQFAREHELDAMPFLIVISPTTRCNLKCLGCYAGEYPKADPLTLADLDRIVSEAKEMGIHFFTISGGEPFAREDLLDLYEKHTDCVFMVYTNGTLLTEKAISRLVTSGNVTPALSLEGGQKETDGRRGRGIYERVMAAMADLKAAGVLFGFSGTATRQSVEAFLQLDFYEEMIERGAMYGWLFHFMPVGKDATTDLMLLSHQRDQLRQTTLAVRRTKPIFVVDFWNDGPLTDGCMAGGTLYFHINWQGDLEPCVFLHYAEKNILGLWQNGGHLSDVLNTPFFRSVRAINRRDPNRLRPCMIKDHNEWMGEAIKQAWREGGRPAPTHSGAEDIVGRLAIEVRALAEDYGVLADLAWNSPAYDWARSQDSPIQRV